MHGKSVTRKIAPVPFGTSVRYANGAVVTTFNPPPPGFDPMTADRPRCATTAIRSDPPAVPPWRAGGTCCASRCAR
jgi:hypothetical protein